MAPGIEVFAEWKRARMGAYGESCRNPYSLAALMSSTDGRRCEDESRTPNDFTS